ncbi:MAG: (2Fe-2S)-binding protein [Burkholderiaceae bacterium]|jgi:carbon-monoxide dehydrogenase small subunit|nr:(2Fe-2S)-binding protein [Burkholderiaceae bacterium]HMN63681.1 (2Fe-2S)-binding protein [Burkholderiaceae bacterium]
MPLKHDIEFTLNGVSTRATVPVDMSTLAMMRDVLGLTGTKYGCGEGECGACTIVVDGVSVNACLMFAVDCDGRQVATIEGLAADPRADALREAFVAHGAVQCGFCTPGMMMQANHLLATHPGADEETIKRGIEGNLCRCTGYRKIVDAIASVAAKPQPGTPGQGERP